jgi:hypothetical protein
MPKNYVIPSPRGCLDRKRASYPSNKQKTIPCIIDMLEKVAFQRAIEREYISEDIAKACPNVMNGAKAGNVIISFEVKKKVE